MTMKCEYPTRWLLAGLLLAPLLLGGCSIEHIHEPWVNAEQRELLEGQIERDEETATELRYRLVRVQAAR
ncbi:MAG: hypothetical protein ACNS61_04640 [Candidatus Wenzhouxiangella sp. M2_3B_020]|jgi:hypothetical protein|nr:hypothetical protein [Xanthomonadales bacterium]|tara:strand:- start:654 stop:863 length:210 start_codon:yes stop_codon:yes gene_type:complete